LAWASATALVLGAAPLTAQTAPDSAVVSGQLAAQHWLALLAASDFGATWDQASRYFRDHVSRDDWHATADHLRITRSTPRSLLEAHLLGTNAAAPLGQLLLRWNTVLSDGHELGERLILVREADQAWRVATYQQYPSIGGDIIAPEHTGRPILLAAPPRPTTIARPAKP
jgi:hypothetical protein